MKTIDRRHDAQMSRIPWRIALLIGDNLHCLRTASRPLFITAHDPQVTGVEHRARVRPRQPGCRGGGFYLRAAGSLYRNRPLPAPVLPGAHVGRRPPDRLRRPIAIWMGDELQMNL